jgi:hypothetical protein
LLVVIGVGAVVGLAIYLGLPESSDPGDGGWADIAFFISPFFALIAGLATALILGLVAWLRLADISFHQARDAALGGGCLGPIVYFGLLVLGGFLFDALLVAGHGYVVIYTIPVVCGVALAVGAAVVGQLLRRMRSSRN